MTADTAYVNGEFLPLAQACVPVLDRGFLFADSVYEVIPVYAGRMFLLPAHLQRLQRSLDGIRLTNPHDVAGWTTLLEQVVDKNGGGDLALYLQVTRGAPARREHRFPEHNRPTVVSFCHERRPPGDDVLARGVAVITRADDRWGRCDIKSTSLLANVLAVDQAICEGASEALLIRDGQVLEGASSNLFAVIDDQLLTPPLSPHILPGVTRAWLLELARANNLPVREQAIPAQALQNATEIWLTSSTREIYPVTRLDGETVGSGVPGPLWQRMRDLVARAFAG